MITRVMTAMACLMVTAVALAYVPDHDIKIERDGLTKFKITGENSWGKVDVEVKDQNLFRGFLAEGKNGDMKVEIRVESAGVLAGWKLSGNIGKMKVDVKASKDGPFKAEWNVEGTVGEYKIKASIDDSWDIDPAAAAVFVCLDAGKKKE